MEKAYRTEDRLIDGVNYRVTPFSARQGMKTLSKITGLAKPALKDADADDEIPIMVLVLEIISQLERSDVEKVVLDLASMTIYDPEGGENFKSLKSDFDLFFSANYAQMAKWLLFALEVNFGDLQKALTDMAGAVPAQSK